MMTERKRSISAYFGDVLSAWSLRGFKGSVHTRDEKLGFVECVNIRSGMVSVRIGSEETEKYRGLDVADLDTFLE